MPTDDEARRPRCRCGGTDLVWGEWGHCRWAGCRDCGWLCLHGIGNNPWATEQAAWRIIDPERVS